jgi:hypothetical protein
MKGQLVYDKEGKLISHRRWFKVIFNPILRKFGWQIVTQIDKKENFIGYILKKYENSKNHEHNNF